MSRDENDEESSNFTIIDDVQEMMENESVKEIGAHAIWSVSSCKQGGKLLSFFLFLLAVVRE